MIAITEIRTENLSAYLHILCAIEDIDGWHIAPKYLDSLEKVIISTVPDNYPLRRKVDCFVWATLENRDFLRSIYYLAFGFYTLRKFKKAKRWFLFLTRCASREIGLEKAFLADLRQDQPSGEVHLLHDKL